MKIMRIRNTIAIGSKKIQSANRFVPIIVLSLLLSCASSVGALQSSSQVPGKIGPRHASEEWIKYEATGIPYEVALEWLMGKESGWGSKRVLFVYLDRRYFNQDNLMLVFGNISSKIPQPTFLNLTLLTDRDVLKKRTEGYAGWIMSNETPYTRLTAESDTCCPPNFTGAQFDRYSDEAKLLICNGGQAREINAKFERPPAKKVAP